MIRPADSTDVPQIRHLYHRAGRPRRPCVRFAEYIIAEDEGHVVGCAAVRSVGNGGYLYGLCVHPDWRCRGIGSALTKARLRRVASKGGGPAVALAMFWNVRFFRRLGFALAKRDRLPRIWRRVSDLSNPTYRRSAVMWHDTDHS